MSRVEAAALPPMTAAPVCQRSVALPVEHGGWGLLLEPIVLGLLVAPAAGGAELGLAAILAFLARHPLKLALADRRRGRRSRRTVLAERVASAYGMGAAAAIAIAVIRAESAFWPALAWAAPLGLVQLAYDARLRSRDLVPELAGALALGAVAPAMALAAGWGIAPALGLWGLLAARALPSVLYVRHRLRLGRGIQGDARPSMFAHLAGLVLAVVLAACRVAPSLAVIAAGILLFRAIHGSSTARASVRPQVLGLREVGFGVLTVALLAVGYFVER